MPAVLNVCVGPDPYRVTGTPSVNVHVQFTTPTLSVDAEPSKATVAPWFTTWSGPAFATGPVVSFTVTVIVSVSEFPEAPRTVSVTTYVPAVLNVCVGPDPYRVTGPPSVNVHVQFATAKSSVDAEPSKVTVAPWFTIWSGAAFATGSVVSGVPTPGAPPPPP